MTGLPKRSLCKHREAVSDSIGLLAGIVFKATKQKITAGEYVDFEELLAELQPWVHDRQASKGHQSKHSKLPISNHGSWSIAFAAYAAHAAQLVSAHPSRGAELFQYMGLIAGVNKDFKPSAWLKYDLAFHRRAAADHYLRWDLADSHFGHSVSLAWMLT